MKTLKLTFTILLILNFISCKKEKTINKNDTVIKEKIEVLSPPIPALNIPHSNFKIDAIKDTIINYKNGTKILIPKNAFLDSKGNIINKEVDLKFRTFSNPLEIYLAGIPMNYNFNGEEKVFESAGMFEITANYKGEKVFVNPTNKIKVNINSFNESNNFNTYDLNKESNVWIETGKDSLNIKSKKEDLIKLPILPIPPKKAGKFSFEIENELYSEISEYENVWFTPVNGKSCGYNAKDIKIKDLKNGTFRVEFIPWVEMKGLNSVCICYLSFKDDVEYNKALNNYKIKYKTLIEREKRIKEIINKEWDLYQKQINDYRIFLTKDKIEKLDGERKIIRSLEVSNFGFVNCDRPINFPQGAKIKPIFLNEVGEKIELKQVVLIERGRNALYRYRDIIKFNPKNDNLLWGITKNGKLAYFTNDNFKALKSKTGKVNLKMNIHTKELKTYDEIVAILFN
jgi:hypothetical protein